MKSLSNQVALLFGARGCQRSQSLKDSLDQLSDQIPDVTFVEVDLGTQLGQRLARAYYVISSATVVLFQDGQMVAQFTGDRSKTSILGTLAAAGLVPSAVA